jgi:hypothetical protein
MNLHNTVRAEGMSGDVEPLRVAIEEMEKVHPRGLVQPLQDHSKYRVERIKAVSVGDNVGDTLPCPSGNASDETGHADIESVVTRFRETCFYLTPASADTPLFLQCVWPLGAANLMPTSFAQPCQRTINVEPEHLGMAMSCPLCGGQFQTPVNSSENGTT